MSESIDRSRQMNVIIATAAAAYRVGYPGPELIYFTVFSSLV